MDSQQAFKQQAAGAVLAYVESGTVVGLGAGSTALLAVRGLAAKLSRGELTGIRAIPCSRVIEAEALRLGIPLTTLEDPALYDRSLSQGVLYDSTPNGRAPRGGPDEAGRVIDLTFDGADEVDPALNLIKGGGGALLREKLIAQASRREIIIVDESKLSPALGTRWAVPIEVIPFGWRNQATYIEKLGAITRLRAGADGKPFLTDQGNLILDSAFGPLTDPVGLAAKLDARTGIVAHGLFLGLATEVIVAGASGIRHLARPAPD